jgi:hypothetical protein
MMVRLSPLCASYPLSPRKVPDADFLSIEGTNADEESKQYCKETQWVCIKGNTCTVEPVTCTVSLFLIKTVNTDPV